MNRLTALVQTMVHARMTRILAGAFALAIAVATSATGPSMLLAQSDNNLDLVSLNLTDQDGQVVSIGAFQPGNTAYTANVASTVTHVTVSASTHVAHNALANAHSRARIYISPKDAQPTSGHQVELNHGANVILVSVHFFEIDQPLKTYSVTVTKAGDPPEGDVPIVGINGGYGLGLAPRSPSCSFVKAIHPKD